MRLIDSVAVILGRALTPDQVGDLSKFQQLHEIDDSDPLLVVLAMIGANRVMMDEVPKLLQQKAEETIALHQQTLITQSTVIAKELIHVLASNIEASNNNWKYRWMRYFGSYLGGVLSLGLFIFYRHIS